MIKIACSLYSDLPTIFACTLGPRVQNAWKMYPMLGLARRILSSRASNQFVGFISCSFSYANLPLIYQQSPSLPTLLMYLHGGMPHLNHEKALSQMLLGMISSCMAKLFWLELAGNLAEKSWLQQLSRRGKFCMREWMHGMRGMRGLPHPMRGGWQVCCIS